MMADWIADGMTQRRTQQLRSPPASLHRAAATPRACIAAFVPPSLVPRLDAAAGEMLHSGAIGRGCCRNPLRATPLLSLATFLAATFVCAIVRGTPLRPRSPNCCIDRGVRSRPSLPLLPRIGLALCLGFSSLDWFGSHRPSPLAVRPLTLRPRARCCLLVCCRKASLRS